MMPIMKNQVAPWFAGLQPDFRDQTTFRHMISMLEREAAEIRRLLPAYKRADLTDIVAECEKELAEADALLLAIYARLETFIYGGASP